MRRSPVVKRSRPLARTPRGTLCRARRRRHEGQAVIEFSFAFVVLLIGIFGAISASVWAIENMAAISATENALRLLSGAQGTRAVASQTIAAASNNGPAKLLINGSSGSVVAQLRPAMFGTQINVIGNAGAGCPATPALVATASGRATIDICWAVGATGEVQVHIIGCAASMVPTAFSISGCKYGVPVDDFAAVQGLVFTT